jgi:hypothetical protein
MLEYRWQPKEIEQALTESGLEIVKGLSDIRGQKDDAATNTTGRTYSFVIARRQA